MKAFKPLWHSGHILIIFPKWFTTNHPLMATLTLPSVSKGIQRVGALG